MKEEDKMELAAKYIYKIYEKGSFSAAARALYISQPSLSATVAKHEGELGFKIFDRSTSRMTLTQEGRIYVEALEEIIEAEQTMQRRIESVRSLGEGMLTVGGASYSSYFLLSAASGRFCKSFPGIKVEIDLGNNSAGTNHIEKLKRHTLDLVISYAVNADGLRSVPLYEENLVVAIRKDAVKSKALLPYAIDRQALASREAMKDAPRTELSLLKELSYIPFESYSDAENKMYDIFGDYRQSLYSLKNYRHSVMHYMLMKEGTGALLTSDIHVLEQAKDDDVLLFLPKCENAKRQLYAYKRKNDSTKNEAAERFLEAMIDICKSGLPFKK